MIAEKIIGEIEKFAPLEAAAKWDNSGIQCISENIHISKMALCLDPSYSLIEKAINNGAHFILTHHPLLLEPSCPACKKRSLAVFGPYFFGRKPRRPGEVFG